MESLFHFFVQMSNLISGFFVNCMLSITRLNQLKHHYEKATNVIMFAHSTFASSAYSVWKNSLGHTILRNFFHTGEEISGEKYSGLRCCSYWALLAFLSLASHTISRSDRRSKTMGKHRTSSCNGRSLFRLFAIATLDCLPRTNP